MEGDAQGNKAHHKPKAGAKAQKRKAALRAKRDPPSEAERRRNVKVRARCAGVASTSLC